MEIYVLSGTIIAGIMLFYCVFSAGNKDEHDRRYRQMCREKKEVEAEENKRETVTLF